MAACCHDDTPDNTGKTPDQEPKRLNNKLRAGDATAVDEAADRMLDAVVPRPQMKGYIAKALEFFCGPVAR